LRNQWKLGHSEGQGKANFGDCSGRAAFMPLHLTQTNTLLNIFTLSSVNVLKQPEGCAPEK